MLRCARYPFWVRRDTGRSRGSDLSPGCILPGREGGNMEVAEREEPRGALNGIQVLDVAEPYGAYVNRLLGDLGADVIKIEPPGGDPGRQMAPLLPVGAEQLSLPFVHANLNKRSIVLDMQQPQDQERFRVLARQADVVVSTEGVAAWATRGVDLKQLSTDFPR